MYWMRGCVVLLVLLSGLSAAEAAPRKTQLLAVAAVKKAKGQKRSARLSARGWLARARHSCSFRGARRARSGRCWYMGRRVRRDVRRQQKLWSRLRHGRSQQASYLRCKGRRFRGRGCALARWSACYHIHRRLFVIVQRLKKTKKRGRRSRCRWRLRLPRERYKVSRFLVKPRYPRR